MDGIEDQLSAQLLPRQRPPKVRAVQRSRQMNSWRIKPEAIRYALGCMEQVYTSALRAASLFLTVSAPAGALRCIN